MYAIFARAGFRALLFAFTISSFFTLLATAKEYPAVVGEFIVRIEEGVKADKLFAPEKFRVVQELVPELNLYLVKANAKLGNFVALSELRAQKNVRYAHRNYLVKTREKVPNDPDFAKLWSLAPQTNGADVAATQAWELGRGGLDASGNEIVVAVVDSGMDLSHPDLVDNLWTNMGEIAGNGIDDDGNGYIDDIHGWNAYGNNGNVPGSSHGTHVAGIIGARADNSIGVTGVNWNVKMMAVGGSTSNVATVSIAYNYVAQQKKLWIESKGLKGANVVVTNNSFGIDYADCNSDNYKAWNDLYNMMGSYGILSVAATANNGVNIDEVGDVPTGCSSPYIVSVTNTTKANRRNTGAGYGLNTIDLGAPGTLIYSTVPNNRYASKTGTSMATPHVAGAIALMHSLGSSAFNRSYLGQPAVASLHIKDVLLRNVDSNADLEGKTVSGGKLNLYKSGIEMSTSSPQFD